MLSKDWLTGFLEAQASFSIIFKKNQTKLGYQVAPDFTLKTPKSEQSILEEIQGMLGIGHLYEGKNEIVLKATKLADAQKLIAFLSEAPFVSPRRAQEFSRWAMCVQMIAHGHHKNKLGLLKIALQRELLHLRRPENDFCHVRRDLDPCHVYQKEGALPHDCRLCFEHEPLVAIRKPLEVS